MKPENEAKVGAVMMTSFIATAVVLALFSALWVRITRRDLEAARSRALLAHLDWRPAPKAKQKRRRNR
ncbi:MAG: hypothetical protein C0524_04510 [Rhodobacter sp.]|nr:hypothetical protein [Rhodobacter sp.]